MRTRTRGSMMLVEDEDDDEGVYVGAGDEEP